MIQYRCTLICILLNTVCNTPFITYSAFGRDTWDEVDRIVAVGDLHGDFHQCVEVLRSAGLINKRNDWIGGSTHLVQLGDIPDRAPDTREIIKLLQKLEKQAKRKNGYVHLLIGNHDAMNVYGELYYVHPGEFKAFTTSNSRTVQDSFYKETVDRIKATTSEENWPVFDNKHETVWKEKFPLGFVEHRLNWESTGSIGEWVCRHNTIIKINDTLFLHGGISPKYKDWSLSKINAKVQVELKNMARDENGIARDEEGPFWYRGLAINDEDKKAAHLTNLLQLHTVSRVVIAHTTTTGTVMPRFNGRVIMVDVGLSRAYGKRLACLLIEGDEFYTIHRGKKLPIPSDSGFGLLNYLKQAAALDPQPSPLNKKIAELEAELTEQRQEAPVSRLGISRESDAVIFSGH